ncbi:MAG: DNA cytosine methyltransferase [Pseudonocardiaceae bacterium]
MTGITFADLFSGGGGMSYGFHAHPQFEVVGAADAQVGKPSSPRGSLACNSTYELNMGIQPVAVDLSTIDPSDLRHLLGLHANLDVLAVCPPCTGFSRTTPTNHLVDDRRNSLVTRTVTFVEEFEPRIVVMENARELLNGKFSHHFDGLRATLEAMGYCVQASIHYLSDFGLPQIRERALVVAVAPELPAHTLESLWNGYQVRPDATTVHRAIGHLPAIAAGVTDSGDPMHVSPRFRRSDSLERLKAIPHDGGSWRQLWQDKKTQHLLTPSMRRHAERADWGSHPDVYGRMAWNKPAPTVKRECGHVGNGRYAHPEQDRLLTLREMANLNGFPETYRFGGTSLTNRYRHVGDAVPPLISHQLAWLCSWILTGIKPDLPDTLLPACRVTSEDLVPVQDSARGAASWQTASKRALHAA